MSPRIPDHSTEQSSDDGRRRSWRRRLLLGLGLAAVLVGLAWSASAATTWWAGDDHAEAAAATAATPEDGARVHDSADAIESWLGLVGGLEQNDDAADELVFGVKAFFAEKYPELFQSLDFVAQRLQAIVADPSTTLADLDTKLDDIDGDGEPASDFHAVPGLVVDLDADIASPDGSGRYDVTVSLDAKVTDDSPLAMRLDGMRIGGRDAEDLIHLQLANTLRIDPSAVAAKKVTMPVTTAGLGSLRVGVQGTYEGEDALRFSAGILGVQGAGTVSAEAGVRLGLLDPDHDGVLDLTEITGPDSLLQPTCVSDGAQVDLNVTTDLAGLTGKAGRITLDDKDLCNGLATPDVELAELGDFRNVTLGDFINGLAQVTQALQTAQDAGDLDIPFVKEPLRDLLHANERLVAFFVDNGFTNADDPMSTITVDTAEDAPLKTVQDVAPRLAEALGVDLDALGLHVAGGRLLLDVTATPDEDEPAASATLDFGDTLAGLGVTDITGTGTATVDPSYHVDMGVGIDLNAGLALADRFYLTNGADGSVATFDAPVTADLHVQAIASALRLTLDDADPDGAVPLVQRKDPAKPMLSVALTDPDKDGRVTLSELSAASALPVTAKVNATVPSTTLSATADAVGFPIASGHVTFGWPTVPDTAGAGALTVTADGDFTSTALPFAFNTDDPRALISQVLEVTRRAVTDLRARIADGDVTTTKPLPLVGKSVADLDPVLVKLQGTLDRLIQSNELVTLDGLKTELTKVIKDAIGSGASAKRAAALDDFVEFAFEKKTSTKPASVVVELHLGACTSDRTEGRDGCTFTTDPVKAPFNLDLGSGSRVGGIAGVGAQGDVQVSYDARADLTLGVQLPDVTMPTKIGDLPKVTGSPKLFVQDDSMVDLGVGARLDGSLQAGLGPLQVGLGHGDDHAKAAIAARFRLAADDPTGQRLIVGTAAFDDFLDELLPSGDVTVHETDDALKASCDGVDGAVDACAVLPVYSDDTDLGTVTFTAPDLLDPSGWEVDSDDVEAHLQSEAIQFALLVDGVRTLTHQISDGLRSLPTGTKIPLIGTDVTAGADVLDDFDEAVLAKADTLSDAIAGAGTAGAVRTKTTEILADLPGLPEGTPPEVTLTCRPSGGGTPVKCADGAFVSDIQSFQVDLHLEYAEDGGTGTFDIGFPGLRLASDGEFTGKAGLVLDLGFGIDRDLGFYIPTEGTEVALTAEASLPKVSGPDLTGDLAFFPIQIEDESNDRADVTVSAGLDLKSSRADKRLPLADLGRAQLTPTLSADALLKLGIKTERLEGAAGMLPTFSTDFVLDAGVSWNGSTGSKPQTNASIDFNHVSVDAGSLVSDVIKPTVKTLRQYTGPLEKPIEAIQKPIPGVAEAARLVGKQAPTWYDAFKAADRASNGENSKALQLIDRVIMLVNLVKKIDTASTSAGQIEIGSFSVLDDAVEQPVPLAQADKLVANPTTKSSNVINQLGLDTASGEFSQARSKGGLSFPAFEKPTSLFGMLLGKDVPLVYYDAGELGIQRGFQFSYPVGPARLYIGGSAGVYGHLAAGFDTYGMRKAYEVLSDDDPTNNGAWQVSKGLLQGFYLDDFDQTGKDVPEIRFEAKLVAGASVGIPGLEAGAEGGVRGTAEFNLKADDTGRLRYPQIAAQLKVNKNPLCFFDATARVDAFIRAYVDTPFGKADYPIASTVIYDQPNLFSFCSTPQEDANHLADLDDGTLTIKPSEAPQTIVMEQLDPDTVQLTGDGYVEEYEPVTKVVADLQGGDDVFEVRPVPAPENTGGTQMVPLPVKACGGAGNDRITVAGGDATLYGESGAGCNPVPTGAGDDTLISGAAADDLVGGPGNDSLDGGASVDVLQGDAGDDVLRGGLGDDDLQGGSGDDTTDYGDHTAPVSISLPGPSGSSGEADVATGVESVRGGSAGDTITLPATGSLMVDGSVGDDTVEANGGTGILMGSDGDDTFVGGTGTVQVIGSGGNDVLVDGPGAQTFLGLEGRDTVDYSAAAGPLRVVIDGEPGDGPEGERRDNIMDADVVIGGDFADQLTGGAAAEELRGGAGPDALEGGPGADSLVGGAGDDSLAGNGGDDRLDGGDGHDVLRGSAASDVLIGAAGDDDLDGEDGNDHLDGGTGDDRVRGGPGADDLQGGDEPTGDFDWVDYSDRTEALTVTMDGVARDGADGGNERDNVHDDIEKYVGGSGRDLVKGSARNQVFQGNDGDDVIEGLRGADLFEGGTGKDVLYDVDANSWLSPDADLVGGFAAVDHFVGGDADDQAYGNGGADLFDLGAGDDDVRAGKDADTIWLGDGNDDVYAGAGADVVEGEAGNDSLRGEDGDDRLRGGPSTGGDSIRGGMGADEIWNGEGGGSVLTGTGAPETDTGPNIVHGYGSPAGGFNPITGSDGDDTFLLGEGDDRVSPGDGADLVDLGNGNNTVSSSAGADTITAGSGKDQLHGGAGNDVIDGGAGDDGVYGDGGDDVLRGAAGDDTLWGYEGKDLIDGGANADSFDGGPDEDTLTYATRTTDLLLSDDGNANDGSAEDLTVVPGDTDRDWMNDTIERYVGGSGDDHIWLADSSRTTAVLEGGAGDDVLEVRSTTNAATTFVGGPGADTMTGSSGADVFDQGAGPDGADDMTGGAGVDKADYSRRPAHTVTVTLDGVADDGAAGEGDNVRPDVELAPGTGTEPEPEPRVVSVAPVSVVEGAAGTSTIARFTVQLSAAPTTPLQVPWTIGGGSATAGVDYTGTGGTVTVPAGALSATVDVTVLGDAADEPDETAQVTVTGAANTARADLTIVDDDVPVVDPPPVVRPTVNVGSAKVKEGKKGLRAMTFTVSLSRATTVPVRVQVSTANGTAKAGKDYVKASRLLTFAPGKTSLTFQVQVRGDRAREKAEKLRVVLSAAVNATTGKPGVGTILNDDR